MTAFRRIFLFLVVNFLVVTVISIILHFINIKPYLQSYGLNYTDLMIFCLIWGFGGAFISLALSRLMAKWMLGVRLIDPKTEDPDLYRLLSTVYRLARAANLPEMPQVGIYDSSEVNAFATGPSRRRSLVAVSSGLLKRMTDQELEGVLGHEIIHIANGDMVTMTLIQGIVNAFVMFLARVLAFVFSGMGQNRNKSSSSSPFFYNVLIFVFQSIFMVFGFMVIAAYSRYREFKADKGGARLAGQDKMVSALEALQRFSQIQDARAGQPAFQALKISSSKQGVVSRFFSTHPPLELRIQRLKEEGANDAEVS